MLNPWLSLSFQAVRLGWETQTNVVAQWMRIAGASTPDRKAVAISDRKETAPAAEDGIAATATPSSQVEAEARERSSKHSQAAQKVLKKHKKQRLGSRRSRSKSWFSFPIEPTRSGEWPPCAWRGPPLAAARVHLLTLDSKAYPQRKHVRGKSRAGCSLSSTWPATARRSLSTPAS